MRHPGCGVHAELGWHFGCEGASEAGSNDGRGASYRGAADGHKAPGEEEETLVERVQGANVVDVRRRRSW